MPRYKLTIEYDGTPFIGWQAQDNGISVQGVLTDAIAAFAGERVFQILEGLAVGEGHCGSPCW